MVSITDLSDFTGLIFIVLQLTAAISTSSLEGSVELPVSSSTVIKQSAASTFKNISAIQKPTKPPGFYEQPLRAPPLLNPNVINEYFNDVIPQYFSIVQKCSDMRFYISTLVDRIRQGGSLREIEEMLISACVLNSQPRNVCSGLIKRFAPTFYFVVQKRPTLTSSIVTGVVFQHAGCSTNATYVEYPIDDPPPGSMEIDQDNTVTEEGEPEIDVIDSTDTVYVTRQMTPQSTTSSSTSRGSSKLPSLFPPQYFKTRSSRSLTPSDTEDNTGKNSPKLTPLENAFTTRRSTRRRRKTTLPATFNPEYPKGDPVSTTRKRKRTTTPEPYKPNPESTRKPKRTTTVKPGSYESTTRKPKRSTTTTTTTTTTEATTQKLTFPPEEPVDEIIDENDPSFGPPIPPIKILHLTDIHVDPLYVDGSNTACENRILCCHADDGPPINRTVVAGPYGSGQACGTPYRTLESALKNIQDFHSDVDIIYMTGDLVPHNLWYTTRPDNTDHIKAVSDVIRRYFPTKLIIPMLGNHEPHTANMFSPRNVPNQLSTQWIYQATYSAWMDWIPKDSATDFLDFGYYSIQVTDDFRLLVINTNHCYDFNFWQLYTFRNMREQLKWLRQELQISKDRGEYVHIIGHVPPGYQGCSKVFSRHYYEIVTSYTSVVRGQFYGHLHTDTFNVYFTKRNKQYPSTVQWITPSLTPYKSNNPSYKIYYADPFNYDIVEHETYIFDLEKANAYGENVEPEWYRLYAATEVYDIPDVRPQTMGLLLDKLAKDPKLFSTYYQYFRKGADKLQAGKCEGYCRRKLLCRTVRPYFEEDEDCDRLQLKIDGSVLPIYDNFDTY